MARRCVAGSIAPQRRQTLRQLSAIVLAAALAGCGVETATTAATGAAMKKKEVEEGRKTMEQARQKIEQSMQETQQRAAKSDERQ
jgi:outer membrane PBP1 activator LpoA protein